MFGGVECQKTTGSLHFHFFGFVQRLHEFASMKQIGKALEEELVKPCELKNFLANICVESYIDPALFTAQRTYLEGAFPAYSEKTESDTSKRWGELQLGRIPAFIYHDSRYKEEANIQPQQEEEATEATVNFKHMFEKAFQFFQSRCQHHIHKEVRGAAIMEV